MELLLSIYLLLNLVLIGTSIVYLFNAPSWEQAAKTLFLVWTPLSFTFIMLYALESYSISIALFVVWLPLTLNITYLVGQQVSELVVMILFWQWLTISAFLALNLWYSVALDINTHNTVRYFTLLLLCLFSPLANKPLKLFNSTILVIVVFPLWMSTMLILVIVEKIASWEPIQLVVTLLLLWIPIGCLLVYFAAHTNGKQITKTVLLLWICLPFALISTRTLIVQFSGWSQQYTQTQQIDLPYAELD